VRDPQVSGANCEAEPRQQWRGFLLNLPREAHLTAYEAI
jgi:hypothetical protein